MKFLCVRKDNSIEELTIGKIYESNSIHGRYVDVKDDDGDYVTKYSYKFVKLDESCEDSGRKIEALTYPKRQGYIIGSHGSSSYKIFFPGFIDGHDADVLPEPVERSGYYLDKKDIVFLDSEFKEGDHVIITKNYGKVRSNAVGTFITQIESSMDSKRQLAGIKINNFTGHNLDGRIDSYNGYYVPIENIRLVKPNDFKIGDTIKVISPMGYAKEGMIGTVIVENEGCNNIGVKFKREDIAGNGHSLRGALIGSEDSLGYWISYKDIIKVEAVETIEIPKTFENFEKTLMINGKETKVYGDKNFTSIEDYLKSTYKDQGEFYEQVFGINRRVASKNNWHPEDQDFSSSCFGWNDFIKDRGIPKKDSEPTINDPFNINDYFKANIF